MIKDDDIKQWTPLIKKITWKYRNNPYKLELEDLEQIGYIGLLKGLRSFNEDLGVEIQTYLYRCIKWSIDKELEYWKNNRRIAICSSSSLDISIGDDNEYTARDLIEDKNVNIEEHVSQSILIDRYKIEIKKTIKCPKEQLFAILILIYDLSIKDAAERINLDLDIAKKMNKSIKDRLKRNLFIRTQWRNYCSYKLQSKLKNINYMLNTESIAVDKIMLEQKLVLNYFNKKGFESVYE
ncbi:hypothetical protein D4A35_08335 [Paraclostridium bifermentans]|uniref:RNA polymerase sigma-70 region 2 domain-containing protein n=1 Tax=Paraclostridium bifermentans TaxID=1490 RepID=A0A5P3XF21_PARBF|nr:sigma-70 family RNA polymerase sigma factor [Paraclostridium bifermentans]QEZ68940.1 hypothetical protein D4A35_08335 [Paraclostridium bifermentans]